jgi:hypothetical protein
MKKTRVIVGSLLLPFVPSLGFSHHDAVSQNVMTRRIVLDTLVKTVPIFTMAASAQAKDKMTIAGRIDAKELTMPPASRASELNGVDNLYYPSWLSGTWDVTQTLVDASTPLGLKFIGGPAGSEAIAAESFKEQQKQLNVPVSLKFRFVDTKFGVAEDRIFNTRQRLDNFAGRSVVSSVEYANVGGSNRASALAMGGSEDTPLQTTLVYFKGPVAQKTFVLGHGVENDPDSNTFAAYESLRSIFALTNQNTAPPITTDSENLWVYQKVDNDTISARLRIASYLNAQSDSLYFDAKNKAVSFADYTLSLKRVA